MCEFTPKACYIKIIISYCKIINGVLLFSCMGTELELHKAVTHNLYSGFDYRLIVFVIVEDPFILFHQYWIFLHVLLECGRCQIALDSSGVHTIEDLVECFINRVSLYAKGTFSQYNLCSNVFSG